jgi:hypothetical protein
MIQVHYLYHLWGTFTVTCKLEPATVLVRGSLATTRALLDRVRWSTARFDEAMGIGSTENDSSPENSTRRVHRSIRNWERVRLSNHGPPDPTMLNLNPDGPNIGYSMALSRAELGDAI